MINLFLAQQPGGNILPYLIIGLAALLEGPITILAAGAGVSLGTLLALPAYLSVVAGNLIADLGWYGLGRFGKIEWLNHIGPKFGVKVQDVKQLQKSLQKNAPRMLFLSKFAVGLPIPILIAVGLNKVPIRRWLFQWLSGEMLKSAILISVGYLYASGIQQAYGSVQTILWVITIILIFAGFITFKKNIKRKDSRIDGISSLSLQDKCEREIVKKNAQDDHRGLVLIPAYNAEGIISQVIQKAGKYLPVLVVDDGSTDHTAQNARKAGAMLLKIPVNQGKGNALQTGFQKALEDGYDFVITLDADGQHDPDEIPEFINIFTKKQADLVIGQRNFSLMPPIRRFSNTLGAMIFSWAVRENIPDNQSGYRLISRRLMQVLGEPGEQGYEFEVEMITKCILHSYVMKWIPIKTIYGDEKSHIHPIHHIVKFIQVTIRTHRLLKKSFENISF